MPLKRANTVATFAGRRSIVPERFILKPGNSYRTASKSAGHLKLSEVTAARKKLNELYKTVGYVISPHSPSFKNWTWFILGLSFYIAIWTPFEVAFRGYLPLEVNSSFIIERIIDVALVIDCTLQFYVAFPDEYGSDYVRNSNEIAMNYIRTWFVIDFISATSGMVENLAFIFPEFNLLLRSLKMFRLLKTFKVWQDKRLSDTQLFILEKFNYSILSLLSFVIAILMLAHWIACAWRMVANFQEEIHWMRLSDVYLTETHTYVLCIYWATTTITTIGYGDAANPETTQERVLATFCMLAGALMWAYIIGGVCSIVQSFNQGDMEFKDTMDKLNRFLKEKRLPQHLRIRLREYFVQRRLMLRDIEYNELMSHMSSSLRGEVARSVNEIWMDKVPWLKAGSTGFISSVALALEPELFAPKEVIIGEDLRVLIRGVAVKDACIHTRGSVWGTDVILTSTRLKRSGNARALTFVHIFTLRREKLQELLNHYPQEKTRLRVATIWMALRRGFIRYAHDITNARLKLAQIVEQARKSGVNIRNVFEKYDVDNSGDLDFDEFTDVVQSLGFELEPDVMRMIITRFDSNNSGSVDYIEFLTFFCPEVLESATLSGKIRIPPLERKLTLRNQRNRLMDAFSVGSENEHVKEIQSIGSTTLMNSKLEEIVTRKLDIVSRTLQFEIETLAERLGVEKVKKRPASPSANQGLQLMQRRQTLLKQARSSGALRQKSIIE